FRALVDRLPRTGGETRWVRTMVAEARQVEVPNLVLRQTRSGSERSIPPRRARRGLLVKVRRLPVFGVGEVADRALRAVGIHQALRCLEDRLSLEHPVRS